MDEGYEELVEAAWDVVNSGPGFAVPSLKRLDAALRKARDEHPQWADDQL